MVAVSTFVSAVQSHPCLSAVSVQSHLCLSAVSVDASDRNVSQSDVC